MVEAVDGLGLDAPVVPTTMPSVTAPTAAAVPTATPDAVTAPNDADAASVPAARAGVGGAVGPLCAVARASAKASVKAIPNPTITWCITPRPHFLAH